MIIRVVEIEIGSEEMVQDGLIPAVCALLKRSTGEVHEPDDTEPEVEEQEEPEEPETEEPAPDEEKPRKRGGRGGSNKGRGKLAARILATADGDFASFSDLAKRIGRKSVSTDIYRACASLVEGGQLETDETGKLFRITSGA